MGQILQDGKKVLEMSVTTLHSKSRPVQTIYPTDLGLLPSWFSISRPPAQEFSPSWNARKRMQERVEISWNSRKSELVKLQYNPNVYKWCISVFPESDCYINVYPSDGSWTLDTFPKSFPVYIGPFPHFLDLCWRKYWYLTLDWSRKPYNMPRKCLRRPRKCVKESTSHHWVSHGIYVNVTVALRETRYASFIDIRIILQFHQFRFPGVSENFNPFLHTFPGIPGRWKFLCRWARYS